MPNFLTTVNFLTMKTWKNQQLKDLIDYLNCNDLMYSMAEMTKKEGDTITFKDEDSNYEINLHGCNTDEMIYFKVDFNRPWHSMMDILQMIPFADEVKAFFNNRDHDSDIFTVK